MAAPLVGHRHCSACGNESLEVRRVKLGNTSVNVGCCIVCDTIKCPKCDRQVAGPFDPTCERCHYCGTSIKMAPK